MSPFSIGLASDATKSPIIDVGSPGRSRPIRTEGCMSPSGCDLIHFMNVK